MFHMVDEQESPAWARVCDLVFQDRRDDVGYYLEQASPKGSSVLEIGCSTGRITEFLADFGKEVHAVDPSAEMIEIARNKIEKLSNPGQVLFSQTTLPELNIISDRKFSLAIVPSLAFMSILSSEEQQKFLHNLRRYLNPGGKLVLEMNVPDPDIILGDPATLYHLMDVDNEEDGGKLVFYHQRYYDDYEQIVETKIVVEFVDVQGIVGEKIVHDLSFRYTFRWEMYHLLRICGFEILSLQGDFDGNPFDAESERMIWVAGARS